jgi:sugar phosphate isomerase/epimerase
VKFGVCGRKFPEAALLGPEKLLDRVHQLGFDGVFFRSILDLDPQLDLDHLQAIRRRADDYRLYFEVGLGRVNPFNTAESPEIRALGTGDYRLGMERMIRAAHVIGCTELWADTANSQTGSWQLHAIDRFRTDVTWPEQLAATQRFLGSLAPVLRELGCRIDLETHEEITTHELVAMIQAIGPDVLGVTLDLANVVIRGEDPLAATRRVAPYVHLSHMRDVVLYFIPQGVARQIRACGDGVIDWSSVLTLVGEHAPDLNLSVENVSGRNDNCIDLYDPRWQASHPDLAIGEILTLVRHAYDTEARMRRGDIADRDSYYPRDGLSPDEQVAFIRRCHAHLRHIVSDAALHPVLRGSTLEPGS